MRRRTELGRRHGGGGARAAGGRLDGGAGPTARRVRPGPGHHQRAGRAGRHRRLDHGRWPWCCSAAVTCRSPPSCTRPGCPAASCSRSVGWPPSRWSPFPGRRSAVRSATASRRRWPSSPWCSGRPARHCGCRAATDAAHPTRPEPPWAFRRAVGLSATLVLLALFGWCAFEVTSGSRTGLAERVTAVAVSLWPLLAVLSARRAHLAWSTGGTVRVGPDLPTIGVVPPDPLGPPSGPTPGDPTGCRESSPRLLWCPRRRPSAHAARELRRRRYDRPMSAVPRWALLSAGGAPLFLVGGWTLAQAAQPDGFDPVRQTISALAATGADHRWIMTVGLAGLGPLSPDDRARPGQRRARRAERCSRWAGWRPWSWSRSRRRPARRLDDARRGRRCGVRGVGRLAGPGGAPSRDGRPSTGSTGTRWLPYAGWHSRRRRSSSGWSAGSPSSSSPTGHGSG